MALWSALHLAVFGGMAAPGQGPRPASGARIIGFRVGFMVMVPGFGRATCASASSSRSIKWCFRAAPDVTDQHHDKEQVEAQVNGLQQIAQFPILVQQVGNGQHAEPDGLEPLWPNSSASLIAEWRSSAHTAEHGRHGRRAASPWACARVAEADDGSHARPGAPAPTKHRHARPFVPGVKLQFLGRQWQVLHVKPSASSPNSSRAISQCNAFATGV